MKRTWFPSHPLGTREAQNQNKFKFDKLYAICIGQNKDCEDDLTIILSNASG